jgi:hypothetical protein
MKTKTLLTIIICLLSVAVYATGTEGLAFTLTDCEAGYAVSVGSADESHIEIPATHNDLPVLEIADEGFIDASFIESITIPNSVTYIGYGAFMGCSGLTTISIPNSVRVIEDDAFMDCWGLTSVTIGSGVVDIFGNPFSHTWMLETINVDTANTVFKSEGNSLIHIGENALIAGTKNSVIPNGVVSIAPAAFMGCVYLTEIVIPSSVEEIGVVAFGYCIELTEIIIPLTVTEINRLAFLGCDELEIFAVASEKPEGWHPDWNALELEWDEDEDYVVISRVPVIWGHVSDSDKIEVVRATTLMGNYPNPFNPTTQIDFYLSHPENISLNIYNLKGQLVRVLYSGDLSAGSHSLTWDGLDHTIKPVSSGIYLYRLNTSTDSVVRKMTLIK